MLLVLPASSKLTCFFLQETLFSQHLLVCALSEAGELAQQLGTSVHNLLTDTSLNMIDTIFTICAGCITMFSFTVRASDKCSYVNRKSHWYMTGFEPRTCRLQVKCCNTRVSLHVWLRRGACVVFAKLYQHRSHLYLTDVWMHWMHPDPPPITYLVKHKLYFGFLRPKSLYKSSFYPRLRPRGIKNRKRSKNYPMSVSWF
ncbi:hypothetical protein RR48_00459 [Papilio machaon]|uniref:Uncharacterized protein n=1 Tax=Papilio machaon TaxID=76193 RepID=A0A0N0PFE4_PAPMA|nr:hypothetical protein RR48_00459 [Papilio machaon]